jgi:hypothetical protein
VPEPVAAGPWIVQRPAVAPVDPRPHDKPYTVSHYEALASQVARERQIADLDRRLSAIERTSDTPRPLRLANGSSNGRASEDRRHG